MINRPIEAGARARSQKKTLPRRRYNTELRPLRPAMLALVLAVQLLSADQKEELRRLYEKNRFLTGGGAPPPPIN